MNLPFYYILFCGREKSCSSCGQGFFDARRMVGALQGWKNALGQLLTRHPTGRGQKSDKFTLLSLIMHQHNCAPLNQISPLFWLSAKRYIIER